MPTEGFIFWKKGEIKRLSSHFMAGEFSCKCGRVECIDQKISMELISRLEMIRLGADPLFITSGYRCEAYQKELAELGYQTALHSQHVLGRAADVKMNNMIWLEASAKLHFHAVGTARTFIHVDLRDDKERYWKYY